MALAGDLGWWLRGGVHHLRRDLLGVAMTDDPFTTAAAPIRVSVQITELSYFAGDPDDPDVRTITVEWRGHDLYAVKHRSQVWNGKKWEWEPQPSSRTEAFRRRTRFNYDTAQRWAHRLILDD